MAYNAMPYCYNPSTRRETLERIRDRECENYLYAKARENMKQLKNERALLNKPSPRSPVLVCRKMKKLPPAAIK